MKGAALGFILLISHALVAQKIEGTVTDQVSGELLVGATFSLNGLLPSLIGDPNGAFQFDNLTPGLHSLEVRYVGYKPRHISGIWVKNGKTTFVEIQMIQDPQQLNEVVITAAPDISKVSSIQVTEEKINRVAASYNDPARLALASSDAIVAHDQNNQISVRGLSPSLNVWRLEGVEIVNPNHLSNAGTFNDQPAATGGGVNILSAQMLDDSQFLVGQMDNSYNNGVAGMFDMNLRKGYAGAHQFTAQASFIGFDFSAEGPMAKGGKASYLANYRYSFTGILGKMGVDFNGETIGFQDLSFNVNVPLKNKASLKIFALGGMSDNNFKAKSLADSEVEKDRSDIHFHGKMGATGSTYEMPLNRNLRLSITSVFSIADDKRNQNTYDVNQIIFASDSSGIQKSIWSNRTKLTWRSKKSTADFGLFFNTYSFDYSTIMNFENTEFIRNLSQFSPYVSWNYDLTKSFGFTGGLTYYYSKQTEKSDNTLDYRVSLKYAKANLAASLNYGKYSQLRLPFQSFVQFQNSGDPFFTDFGIISSFRYIANIQYRIDDVHLKLEGFYYDFPEVEQRPEDDQPFFGYTKNARTYGLSLGFSGVTEKVYFDANATIFNSKFNTDADNPYNVKQSYNVIFGTKWNYKKKEESRTFSFNLKSLYQGGLYQFSTDQNFKDRMGDYLRLDFRVQWVRNKPKSTISWALDIQNLTNRQNEAFQYYDNFTRQLETNYQLGFIPILSYRVEF